jgi:hypothetical protein
LHMEAILIRGRFWDLITGDEKLGDESEASDVEEEKFAF